jgi:hypothetical protein
MATQRTPKNSGHLSVANTLASQAMPPGAGGGGLGLNTPRNLPTLNGMRAPAPPPPVNRPTMPVGGAVGAGPPPPLGALRAPQAGPPTDIRAVLARLFQSGGGGGGAGGPPLG